MKTGKRLCILLLIVSMLLLNGCWNYQEIERLSMVSGIAIDRGTAGHKYHFTFEFLDLSEDRPGSKLLETEGNTVFDGIRNVIGKSQKKLTFSECKVVVISKDLASEGIAPLLDFVSRDAEPRLTLVPMISEEKTAGEILQQEPVTNHLICLEIDQMLVQNVASLSKAPRVKLYQANNMLAGEGTSLILPSIKIAKQQTATTVELSGSAIFKKDKLLGFLDTDQSQLMLFIKNQIKGGLLLTSPDSDGRNVTLEIEESGTKITPVIAQNPPAFRIEIKTVCALGEDQTNKSHITAERIQQVEKSAKSGLETSVSKLIKTAQDQYKCDIFGFGNLIYQNDPQRWEQDKQKWDEIFRTMNVTVTADIQINNTAKVGD
ncbi:Ger(x)C family spore germination protein [Caproiciproducens sp. CPB-2]|uniref:Ger(x)C family spore germination protein n=1 Tax=unclassified Caproiciproducens TaxID=2643836 RepID=UPI0023D9E837|nr:Ger(x)C family spore germination protein [Caproiciproducens sp. CPB-2]MDF1495294.1 Ger(x)C family spore germination protein [Caproiciproducens sp. CPB-2]